MRAVQRFGLLGDDGLRIRVKPSQVILFLDQLVLLKGSVKDMCQCRDQPSLDS